MKFPKLTQNNIVCSIQNTLIFSISLWACCQKPKMRDSQSAAKWEIGNKICVIMPVKVK